MTSLIRDHYYHAYNRGLNGENIFFNTGNYEHCVRLAEEYGTRYGARLLAYCLMPNHYHFLIKQENDVPISKFINVLFNAYVQAVNRQKGRKGPLFEGRFRYILVDKENYLLHLCRYIHRNPVKAGLVQDPEDWPHSNYLEWIGRRRGRLQESEFMLEHFGSPREYQDFVQDLNIGRQLERELAGYLLE